MESEVKPPPAIPTTCASGESWCAQACDGLRPRSESEAERAPLGIPADRPSRPGMDHASAQRGHLLERGVHLGHSEIRQRGRVAWPNATFVNAQHWSPALSLPTATFELAALGEFDAEEA